MWTFGKFLKASGNIFKKKGKAVLVVTTKEEHYSFLTTVSICLSLSSNTCRHLYSSSLRDIEKVSFAVCETII
jgi:hypothetical protein